MMLATIPGGLLAAQQDGETTVQTLWEFLSSGGPVMIPIALCSLLALALSFERWRGTRRSRVLSARADEIDAAMQKGDLDAAAKLCDEDDTAMARILRAGLRRRGRAIGEVESAMEDQAAKELEKLRSNIRALQVIASVAPLLGLLGTVLGIQEAFHRVVKTKMGEPEMLASGIEVALVTTIAGLCVAIPTMLIAAHFASKARRLLLACDERLAPHVERIAAKAELRDAA